MFIPFKKYEAAGNDFIVVDRADFEGMSHADAESLIQKTAHRWCDRHFGIGADGVLLLDLWEDSGEPFASMSIVNADGSMAGMCGNGIRCAAMEWDCRYGLLSRGDLRVMTRGGIQRVSREPEARDFIGADIAQCAFVRHLSLNTARRVWNGAEIDVGNPHAVFELTAGDLSPDEALMSFGAELSSHCSFCDRANVEFIREIDENTLEMRVYERGVGPTLACGTGCVASAYAYCRCRNLSGIRISVQTSGGEIYVEIPKSIDFSGNANIASQGAFSKIRLIGPARFVYSGTIEAV